MWMKLKVSDKLLSPEQVHNTDEKSLLWRCTPKRTLTTDDAETPLGFKVSKDHIMASSGMMDCGVCLETFNQKDFKPKILPCGHTFCSKCLLSLVQSHQGLVPCPMCKRPQRITDVSLLTTNFSIFNFQTNYQDMCAKLKGPDVSAGHCDEHGEHKLFLCKSCGVWICHVCTVTEHPTGKCDVISIKKALVEKKEDMRVQLQQSTEESKKMLAHLENQGSELQHWYNTHDQFMLKHLKIQETCKKITFKVDDACKVLSSLKNKGINIIKSFLELKEKLVGAEKLQDVDVCAQKISQFRKRAQEWMEVAGHMSSWKSEVAHVKNLEMISNFTQELYQAVETLSSVQTEFIINKTRESFMEILESSTSEHVEIEVDGRPFFAKVSSRSTTSTVLGQYLDSERPPPEACIIQMAALMAKFSQVYVEVQTPQKRLHLPLVKDSKGCFWLKNQQDASPPSHRPHLLIPMKTLLRSGRVWFKHWFAQRFSNLENITSENSSTVVITSPSSFQAQDPPEGAFIMTADVVLMLSPVVHVSLGLEWDGKTQGFLSIQLFGGAQRDVQFQLLCCGDNGQSYHKSRLLSVANRESPGENVVGGDYDGAGGRSQLPDLPPEEIKGCPVTTGLVSSKPNSAQFVIYTRDLPGANDPLGFGKVITGLDVLDGVLKVEDIRDVILADCVCFWKFSF